MARRPVIFIACLALELAVIGAWWILRRESPGHAPGEAPAAPPQMPASDAAPAPPVVANVERAPEPGAVSPAVAAAERVVRELGLELATGSADGPVLIAVEKESGRPIAGVLLIVHEYRPNPGRVGRPGPPLPPHRLDFLRWNDVSRPQDVYVSGDDGRVRVKRLVANSLVVAWHPNFHGSLWLRSDVGSEARVALEATKLVRVRVTDAGGKPRADVPIEFTEATKEKSPIGRKFRSGVDGLVELHPFEVVGPQRGAFTVVRVALAIPLAEGLPGVERLIDLNRLPDEPIELTMPPTGSLAIRVVDGAGALIPDATGSFEAGIVESADPRDPRRQIARLRRGRGSLPLVHGECELAPVGLGLAFEISAYSLGHEGPSRVVAGPLSDGERVECILPLATASPTLSGRLVDGAGHATADSHATVQFLPPDTGVVPWNRDEGAAEYFTTDAAGRFRTGLPRPLRPRPLLRFTRIDDHGLWTARGERQLEETLTDSLDLGDVVVAPLPVLAAGVVVDRDGSPLEGVEVTVEVRPGGPSPELEPFRDVYGLGGVSDADGRFEILGPIGDVEILLTAASNFIPGRANVRARPGQRDVRIVLRRERQLDAAVLLDDGVPPAAIRLQFRAKQSDPWHFDVPVGPDHKVSLFPGDFDSVDVRFIARGLDPKPIELLVVRKILLADDAPTVDPRLDPADLRGRLAASRFVLRDRDGNAVTDARATLWSEPLDGATDEAFVADARAAREGDLNPGRYRGAPSAFEAGPDGVLSVVAASVGAPVLIEAPGFVPKRVETTAAEQELVLERASCVRLEIEEAWLVSQLPYHLRASLTREQSGAAPAPTRALSDGYALDAPVAGPGRYRLRVTVARQLDDGRLLERELTPKPALIDVGDPPTRLPIEVHVDPEPLRRLDPERDSSR